MLRPLPYTKPHPYLIRSASSEEGMLHIARQGRPFMMNVQSNEVTRHRMDLYRRTLREQGMDEAAVADTVDQCWVWRNVLVAETDAEAERIAIPAFEAMHDFRTAMRRRVYEEQGVSIVPMPAPGAAPAARMVVEHSLIHGSPATVAAKLAQVAAIGVILNPSNPTAGDQLRERQKVARAIGLQLHVLRASSDREIEAAFETIVQQRIAALDVAADPFFDTRRDKLVALSARHAVPANVPFSRLCRGRRPDELWHRSSRSVSPSWRLCRPSSEGRQAR